MHYYIIRYHLYPCMYFAIVLLIVHNIPGLSRVRNFKPTLLTTFNGTTHMRNIMYCLCIILVNCITSEWTETLGAIFVSVNKNTCNHLQFLFCKYTLIFSSCLFLGGKMASSYPLRCKSLCIPYLYKDGCPISAQGGRCPSHHAKLNDLYVDSHCHLDDMAAKYKFNLSEIHPPPSTCPWLCNKLCLSFKLSLS